MPSKSSLSDGSLSLVMIGGVIPIDRGGWFYEPSFAKALSLHLRQTGHGWDCSATSWRLAGRHGRWCCFSGDQDRISWKRILRKDE